MTALTFPSSPTTGQIYDAPNGIQYVYDGVKWSVENISSSNAEVTNSVQDRVAPMFVNGENTGIEFTYDSDTNTISATITGTVGDTLVNGDNEFSLESNGTVTLNGELFTSFSGNYNDLSGKPVIPTNTNQLTNGAGFISSTASLVNGSHELVLGADGATTLPNTLNVANGDNGSISGENGISVRSLNGNQLSLGFTRSLAGMPAPDNANISAFFLDGSGASIEVNTDTTGNIWQFDTNGNTTLPGGIKQSYQDNTSCTAGVDTVIYTSTNGNKHAIKLFVMVEGSQGSSWETQACDIIAVKGFVNDIVHVTAYGVTYSGATPLATFDGRWNALTSKIEITCQPTALNDVRTSVHAIEMTTND